MSKQLTLLLSGAVLATILFLLVFIDKNAVIAFLNKHNLLPQPERFTELYFEDHETLPKQIIATEEADFKFTVHNLEYEPFTYDYKVEAISTQESKLLDQGSFTLEHDTYKTLANTISTSTEEANIRTKINVSLENKNQSIHFWVNSN